MENLLRHSLQPADWVKGTSLLDEKIRGYVESVSPLGGLAIVRVVESDHQDAVGNTVECRVSRLERLPEEIFTDGESLLQLIDIALMTGDKDWFMELTSLLPPFISSH